MSELSPLQKSAIAVVAAQIEALSAAVDKLEAAEKQRRQLAEMDHVHFGGNGHLHEHKGETE